MKRQIFHAILATSVICAAHAMADPLGFNKIVCLTNSDTIVGVPFRMQGSPRDLMAGAPGAVEGNPDLAEITLQSVNLTPGSLDRHYLKFDGGPRDGRWYDITANSATSVTIDLNGDNLDGVGSGNPVTITEYWTLDTLFPPDQATTSWTENPENPGEMIQNGHAIRASTGTLAFERRTLVLLKNSNGEGINRAASAPFYIVNNQWRDAESDTNLGDTILYPDSNFTIRHPSSVLHPTTFRSWGEVDTSSHVLPLYTSTSGQRDILIGLPRPIDLTLSELNLWESGAFVQSVGSLAFERRDLLLVFNNEQQSINKSVQHVYYHNGINWLEAGADQAIRDDALIPAGSGFIVRKYPNVSGETAFWNNTPPY